MLARIHPHSADLYLVGYLVLVCVTGGKGEVLREEDERRLGRLHRRAGELRLWRNARERNIEVWRFSTGNGRIEKVRLGDFWPEVALPVSLSSEVEVPLEWVGEPVEVELWLGGEGFVRLSTGASGGLNPYHTSFRVTDEARGGERIEIEAEVVPHGVWGEMVPEPRIERAALVVPEREVRGLERDLWVSLEAARQLGEHDAVPLLLDAAEEAFASLAGSWPTATDVFLPRHLRRYSSAGERLPWSLPEDPGSVTPLPPEARQAVRRARRLLAKRIEEIEAGHPPAGRLALTGHAHLDLAWLWPVAEARRKGRRTFASVLSLMDRYPEFTFNQSSAQLYAWIEEDDPELFERVRERVAEGRWEPVGGSWVENDCQIPGGESMVRQLLYGQRYFEEKFGVRSKVAWLPDAFGFSPALPQILKGAGIEGFFTYKLNWNEADRFPHDLFLWEGLDGTTVLAHHFDNPGQDYNGNVTPHDLLGTWRNFRGKRYHPESLFSFGWGDGGGGPSEEMLENYARLKEFPALPRLRMTRVEDFFASLPREGLPRWVGELYLELHRGTLTTQGRIKKLNREAEHRLVEAEALRAVAHALGREKYPARELERAWKTLLLNQFHDILPGSSIHEVYDEAVPQLEGVVTAAEEVRDGALGGPAGDGTSRVVNASVWPRPLSVVVPNLDGDVELEGEPLPTQRVEEGVLVCDPERLVPPLGWVTLRRGGAGSRKPSTTVRASEEDGRFVLENEIIRAEVGPDGTLWRVFDRKVGREVLDGRGNQLWAYTDEPREWEAWDVDEDYGREGEEVGGVEGIEVVEEGPLRGSVRVRRRFRSSRIVQTYRLLAGSRRLDVVTEVEWHERRVLLRSLFPLRVRSHEATFETMFGAHHRPTHRNTSWDEARFEVSAHRFADLSEPGYGVALLNDGRYGHSAEGNVLGISLLRGPLFPDPLADEGRHRFTFSLLPHRGDWTESGVVREALWLNSPSFVVSGGEGLPDAFSFCGVEGVELALGSLKLAGDGEELILRLYEPHGARGECALRFGVPVERVRRANLLEEPGEELDVRGDVVRLFVRPFEVVTLRIGLSKE